MVCLFISANVNVAVALKMYFFPPLDIGLDFFDHQMPKTHGGNIIDLALNLLKTESWSGYIPICLHIDVVLMQRILSHTWLLSNMPSHRCRVAVAILPAPCVMSLERVENSLEKCLYTYLRPIDESPCKRTDKLKVNEWKLKVKAQSSMGFTTHNRIMKQTFENLPDSFPGISQLSNEATIQELARRSFPGISQPSNEATIRELSRHTMKKNLQSCTISGYWHNLSQCFAPVLTGSRLPVWKRTF